MITFQVSAISFSAKGDYFVTVGVRSVKFWYIGSTDNANKVCFFIRKGKKLNRNGYLCVYVMKKFYIPKK